MKLSTLILTFFTGILLSMNPAQASGKTIKYSQDKLNFEGLFFPAAKKNAPGIVILHNWLGVTAETEKQALRFQKLGYNVFAADLFGAGVRPSNPQDAGALTSKYKADRKLLRERVSLAIKELSHQPGVDASKMAVIGYCFGGTAAIEAGRSGENLKAIISFHGGLDSPTPEDGAHIKAKVLALHGAIDPYVSAKDVAAFENEMQTNKVDYELIKYSGTVHSFTDVGAGTDITKGAAYNAESDEKSFARAKDFLAEAFKK